MTWQGTRKIAFIPLVRTGITPPDVIPPDWAGQIQTRLFFNPQLDRLGRTVKGQTDRSVRAYFYTVSSGAAAFDAEVLPQQSIAEEAVPPDALASMTAQLQADGFVGGVIVMLGGPGGGQTTWAGDSLTPSSFSWSRFCMSDNLGNWIGELMHQAQLTNFADFFDFGGNMGSYDQMAGYAATHPCVWSKRAAGWLDPSSVPLHPGGTAQYLLHAATLPQPPPTGRWAAVQIGADVPYLMVEARLAADQFDVNIASEGVIVYRVQTTDPYGTPQNSMAQLELLSANALLPGASFTAGDVTVEVVSQPPGGDFLVQVTSPKTTGIVPDVFELTELVAAKRVTDAGFVPKFTTKAGATGRLWVASQSPAAGSSAPAGATVNMVLHGGAMP